jgi:hypothetical protein
MNRDKEAVPGSKRMPQRELLLQHALELTMGDRNAEYGAPFENHDQIAGLWRAYFQTRVEHSNFRIGHIDAEDVAMCMVLLKVARAAQRVRGKDPLGVDTFADMIAYASIAGECRANQIDVDETPRQTEG